MVTKTSKTFDRPFLASTNIVASNDINEESLHSLADLVRSCSALSSAFCFCSSAEALAECCARTSFAISESFLVVVVFLCILRTAVEAFCLCARNLKRPNIDVRTGCATTMADSVVVVAPAPVVQTVCHGWAAPIRDDVMCSADRRDIPSTFSGSGPTW